MVNLPKLIMDDGQISKSPEVVIVKTTPEHIAALKKNLRVEDAAEMLKLGADIQHTIWLTYRRALMRKTALIDGRVAAFWGLHGTFMGQTGVPFLLTTPEVYKISPLKFVRIYQQQVIDMLEMFPRLENWVDSSYTASIRLLEIIGFSLDGPEPKGKNGALYRRFEIRY